MILQLRLDGVKVGRKARLLDEYFVSPARRSVEADQHEVQIHRQAVHQDDLAEPCTNEPSATFPKDFVIGIPGRFAFKMSVDTTIRPVFQLLLD
ncbi:MAG: hypothetical protein IIB59_05510 [Planctomycetes bacterium]|nr:hypothetical protein [Planctomycetota bacterium]